MTSTAWLSKRARALEPSVILRIAADVQRRKAAGQTIANLTVGDFDGRAFPIAPELADAIARAMAAGANTYPPLEGVRALREAIVEHTEATHGFRVPLESVLVGSGARPFCFATYQCLLDPGDVVVYGAPSWSNEDYSALSGARSIVVETVAERGFLPTATELEPLLPQARLLCLNTPLNPTGTAFDEPTLCAILELVVRENHARLAVDRAPLFVMYDQVYSELTFDGVAHVHPSRVLPEADPYVITIDAISKGLAATGLRVGWAFVPEPLFAPIRDVVCHAGAWAPTPIQVATAGFLHSDAGRRHRQSVRAELQRRMHCLTRGLAALRSEGAPVDYVEPRGGLYVAVRFDWKGRRHRGTTIENDEATRRLLLETAGVAVIPFSAFFAREDSGWFRISVGAADTAELERACEGVRKVIAELE
jgi:aspartate aminotransferase